MIISRTPFRISLFGGGTDYPAWYREHGGEVLATTINKYCYLTCRYLPPFFEHSYRIVWSKIERCSSVDEITHPAVREILRSMKIERGVEIHHDGDLPARAGIGSSSAFTVGLLRALKALQGSMISKEQLAKEAIWMEQECLRETVGSQDQVLAAHGGFNHLVFHTNGEIDVNPVTLTRQRMLELESHLMLFFTGIKRTASDVADTYVNGIKNKHKQLKTIQGMVGESLSILGSERDLSALGELLHDAWQAKRSLSRRVSNRRIDAMYSQARAAGALGGKLTGAGGGGFLLLFVPPEKQNKVREALHELLWVPFEFENSGSEIIFYEPELEGVE